MSELTEEQTRHRSMIEHAVKVQGLTIHSWSFEDDDERDVAKLGRFALVEDDEDNGLIENDEGELSASVVGAREHNNERVAFHFKPDEFDMGVEVDPMALELAG